MTFSARVGSLTRTMGWAYSTDTEDDELIAPDKPIFEGSITQIVKQIEDYKEFQDDLDYRLIQSWFFREARIIEVDAGTHGSTNPREIDFMIRCLGRDKVSVILDREPIGRGVGRIPLPVGEKKGRAAFTLSPDVIRWVKSQPNQAAYVEKLIRSDSGFIDWMVAQSLE